MNYPEGRVNLEYSEKQRLFYFSYDPEELKTGMLPELSEIKFELAVYFALLEL